VRHTYLLAEAPVKILFPRIQTHEAFGSEDQWELKFHKNNGASLSMGYGLTGEAGCICPAFRSLNVACAPLQRELCFRNAT